MLVVSIALKVGCVRTYNRAVTFSKMIEVFFPLYIDYGKVLQATLLGFTSTMTKDIANNINVDARYILESPIFNIEGPCYRLRYL